MNDFRLDQAQADRLVCRLREALPQLLAVYAFGSRVQGMAGPDSDLDLSVLVGRLCRPFAAVGAGR